MAYVHRLEGFGRWILKDFNLEVQFKLVKINPVYAYFMQFICNSYYTVVMQ